jgi:hypothetical protein
MSCSASGGRALPDSRSDGGLRVIRGHQRKQRVDAHALGARFISELLFPGFVATGAVAAFGDEGGCV